VSGQWDCHILLQAVSGTNITIRGAMRDETGDNLEILIASTVKTRFHPRVSKIEKFLLYWLPPLGWMGLIFSASADTASAKRSSGLFVPLMHWLFPGMTSEHIELLHFAFRKCGHLTEFAILALLCWRAIRQPQRGDLRPWRWDEAGLALTLVFAYAATDELHQVFVPQRTGMVADIFIDTIGGALGLFALWLMGKIFKRW
jgi:VanZ family protein